MNEPRPTPETINEADLALILRTRFGGRVFVETLDRISNEKELLCVLARYISFNSVFGSGVVNLAAQIRLQQDLFGDPNETTEAACVSVSAPIFFAAIAEFGDQTHIDHRTLALATLKGAAGFFGYSPEELDSFACLNESAKISMRRVLDGYGVDRSLKEREVFSSIGFHIGSEMLADEEFNSLDRFLKSRYPDVVQYLKKVNVEISGNDVQAYDWIQIHTSVEATHLTAAIAGANLALRYYAGSQTASSVKGWILDGFRSFSVVQTDFMKALLDPPVNVASRYAMQPLSF
jgi:hypothetical protein